MKALTLHRPWPWAICSPAIPAELRKPVENRGWAPPAWLIGQRLALHAGKTWDEESAEDMRDGAYGGRLACPPAAEHPVGVVAVVTVRGWLAAEGLFVGRRRLIRWRGLDESEAFALAQSPWFCGPIGWVPGDVRALDEAVPCKGAQGLWDLPADVEARVLAQINNVAGRAPA